MKYVLLDITVLIVLLISGCNQDVRNDIKNIPAIDKYASFDRAIELLIKERPEPKETQSLLETYLTQYPEEGRWVYLFLGHCKLSNLVYEIESKYQNSMDPEVELGNLRNPWNFDKNNANDIMHWYLLAQEYKHSEIDATTQCLLLSIFAYGNKSSPEYKDEIIFCISRLANQYKFSPDGYILKKWLTKFALKEPFSINSLKGSLDAVFKDIPEREYNEKIISNIELYKKAESLFQQNRFDEAIEQYRSAGFYLLEPRFGYIGGRGFSRWGPEDGETPDKKKWVGGINLIPLASKKIAECYKSKAALLDNQYGLSMELVKCTKIEYYKTAIFYYWLAASWQYKLLEDSKNKVVELRGKIAEIERLK